jgi:monoterpene epsilon-lactone hydrolase
MARENNRPLEDLYTGWLKTISANPAIALEEIRELFEHWGDVTSEPRAVDYIEIDAGGVEAMWAIPKRGSADRALLCIHGGGYVLSSMYSHRKLYGHFAKATGCRALIVNYRRAPEHAHPGPVDDVVLAYRWLLQQQTHLPQHIAFLGDSAGGALAITAMLRARENGLPLPAAAIALAPYIDVEALGESYDTNAGKDKLGSRAATLQFVNLVLGETGDRRAPLINPLFADLRGLPPLLLQVGGHDVLLDDSRAFHAKAQAAGADSSLEVIPSMQHVFHVLAGTDERADEAIARAARWVRPKLGLT